MEWFEAVILGIIQGLTEFLPVSSSGHLIIGRELLGINAPENTTFEVAVHAATVLSTITILWKEIANLFAKFFKFQWNAETQYIVKIGISLLPIMVVGIFFKEEVEALFSNLAFVGVMLLFTALLLTLTHFAKFKQRKEVGFGSAFVIGLAQAVAVMPGLSRSGTTIATGLLIGVKKEEVANFSFLMVIIPILGEMFLSVVGGEFSFSQSGIALPSLLCGFLAAYLSGLLACKFMISIVKRTKLIWFALYCAIVGIITICSVIF